MYRIPLRPACHSGTIQNMHASARLSVIRRPELVAAAGDWPGLRSAVQAGADAVYFGCTDLNMRYEAANFDLLEIKKAVAFLHQHDKKAYLTVNTIVYDREALKLKRLLRQARASGVDAVIAWDIAVIEAARALGIPVHLSTQASVANASAVIFFAGLGVRRVVLARECSLTDIAGIIRQLKRRRVHCEVETFIHGAMCMSISGRCFLSHALSGRSANRGRCLHPCRRRYLIKDTEEGKEMILGRDYILSAQDLCAVDFLDRLIVAGIDAFKIEGRMRSPDYIATVTAVYRCAIDAFFAGTLSAELKAALKARLGEVFNRGFSSGFYFGPPRAGGSPGGGAAAEKVFLGEVVNFYDRIQVAEILVRNQRVKKNDTILFYGKTTPASWAQAQELQIDHRPVRAAGKGSSVGIKIPFLVRPRDKVFLWKKKRSADTR
ncbi:MAG TPA: peptidase U32 family protein [Candidatus Omnitrophota bacterium]|nr:peptidase U32 family protein [Candidatus Omnitrophota bacterium]